MSNRVVQKPKGLGQSVRKPVVVQLSPKKVVAPESSSSSAPEVIVVPQSLKVVNKVNAVNATATTAVGRGHGHGHGHCGGGSGSSVIRPLRCAAPLEPECCEDKSKWVKVDDKKDDKKKDKDDCGCEEKKDDCGCDGKKPRHHDNSDDEEDSTGPICKCDKCRDGKKKRHNSDFVKELLKSKAFLTLKDSANPEGLFTAPHRVPPLDPEQFQADLFNLLALETGIGYGAQIAQFLCNYLVIGFGPAGTPLPFGAASSLADVVLPQVVVYNTVGGCLTEVSTIDSGTVGDNEGLFWSIAISPSQQRPLIAVFEQLYSEPNTSDGDQDVLTVVVRIYQVNQDGTTTLLSTTDLADLFPDITYGTFFNPTAEVLVEFSSDGKYLVVAFSTGGDDDLTSNIAILRVNNDGSLSVVDTIAIPSVTLPGDQTVLFTVQPPTGNTFFEDACKDGLYHLVLGYYSLATLTAGEDPSTAFGVAALLVSYDFNADNGTLTQTGQVRVPQSIIGYDVHPCLDRIIVNTRESALPGACSDDPISVLVDPLTPFADFAENVPNPGDELRLYSFDKNAKHYKGNRDDDVQNGALALVASHDLGGRALSARWSHSGKRLAITFRIAVLLLTGNPLASSDPHTVPLGLVQPPSVLAVFSYDRKSDSLEFEDVKNAAAAAFGLAWSNDDSLLAVSGQASPDVNATQLYAVSNNQSKWVEVNKY